jgi:hypothetical protein
MTRTLYGALHNKTITQAEYEAKYKKHLQTLKLGMLGIDKSERVAVLVRDASMYNKRMENCYNIILPEFL